MTPALEGGEWSAARPDSVPILQEAGWAPAPVWTGGKPRPHRNSFSDHLARSSVAIPTELPRPQLRKVLVHSAKGLSWEIALHVPYIVTVE